MPGNLSDEVENFFAEVDAITFDRAKSEDIAPRTNWIVQVDSKSNLPFYHNFVTKETTWNIPDEYQSYLDEYKAYLQHKNAQLDLKKGEMKEVPVLVLPEGNARKRRRIKRAFMRANAGKTNLLDAPVEFLSEYIAYSDSSSEDESSDSKRSSQVTMLNEPMEVASHTSESPTAFIGPQLPLSPPKCEPTSLTPGELSKLLLEKFATAHPECGKLSRLQVAYIQFTTRWEDWKAGHLSDVRYKEKLEEVSSFLCEYEQGLKLEAVDGCPPNGTHSLPICQGGSATLNQSKENIRETKSLEVSANRPESGSSNLLQRPGIEIRTAPCDQNVDNDLAVHSKGIKPQQNFPVKDTGSDISVVDRDGTDLPEKWSQARDL